MPRAGLQTAGRACRLGLMDRQTSAAARAGRLGRVPALALAAALLAGGGASAEAQGSAVVLMYHRVGEEQRFDTSVSIAQFESHLAELTSGRYSVLPLREIARRLASGPPLPERTVGLSFDDAHLGSYRNAWPQLEAAGLPVTIFIASDHIDQGLKGYMDWPTLRALAAGGLVEIGIQGAAHDHLASRPLADARADIARAIERVAAELGAPPTLFSYPYGEYGLALRDAVAELGFEAAFGQHSGAFDASDDRYALPRFAMSRSQGDLERLRLAANSLPLPVAGLSPRDPLLRGAANPPRFGFTPLGPAAEGAEIACYANGRALPLARAEDGRLSARLPAALPPGRHRINCTQPAPEGRWRWRGTLFTVPRG